MTKKYRTAEQITQSILNRHKFVQAETARAWTSHHITNLPCTLLNSSTVDEKKSMQPYKLIYESMLATILSYFTWADDCNFAGILEFEHSGGHPQVSQRFWFVACNWKCLQIKLQTQANDATNSCRCNYLGACMHDCKPVIATKVNKMVASARARVGSFMV